MNRNTEVALFESVLLGRDVTCRSANSSSSSLAELETLCSLARQFVHSQHTIEARDSRRHTCSASLPFSWGPSSSPTSQIQHLYPPSIIVHGDPPFPPHLRHFHHLPVFQRYKGIVQRFEQRFKLFELLVLFFAKVGQLVCILLADRCVKFSGSIASRDV